MKNLALDARCKFAMFKVFTGINRQLAEVSFSQAIDLASRCGGLGLEKSPFFVGESYLEKAFDSGFAKYIERIERDKAARADKSNEEWIAVFTDLADQAGRTCGSSHDVYQQRFSASVDVAIQYQTDERKADLIDCAKQWDYATGDELNQARHWNDENGYCQHGIELGCCPVGCE